jgi:competence protein ComEC
MNLIKWLNTKGKFSYDRLIFFLTAPLILLGSFIGGQILNNIYFLNQFYLICLILLFLLLILLVFAYFLIKNNKNVVLLFFIFILIILSFSVLYRFSIGDLSYNYSTLQQYIAKYPYFYVRTTDFIQDYEKYSRIKAYIIGFTDFKKIEKTKIFVYFYSDTISSISSGSIFLFSTDLLKKYSTINFLEDRQRICLSRIDSIARIKDGSWLGKFRINVRKIIFEKLFKFYDRWNAASIYAIITGSRQFIFQPLMDAFQNTGTSHLFALSGQHLSILLLILGIFTSNSIILILFSLLYLAFAGWQVSFLRAFFSLLFAIIIKRYNLKPNFENICAILTLLVFIFEPVDVLSISFLLSLSAIMAILAIYLIVPKFKKKIFNVVLLPFLFSLNISFFQMPIILSTFGKTHLLSPIINLVAIPLFCITIYFVVASLFINPFCIFSNISSGLLNLLSLFLLFFAKYKIFILNLKLSEAFGFLLFFLIYTLYYLLT